MNQSLRPQCMPSWTRQGKIYNRLDSETNLMAGESGQTGVNELLQMLIEDRHAKDTEKAHRDRERKEENKR